MTNKVMCPSEARERLDAYLATAPGEENGPLFFFRYENRLKAMDVASLQSAVLLSLCSDKGGRPEKEMENCAEKVFKSTLNP